MVGSHLDAIADLQVHTVLPAVVENTGEKLSDEPLMAVFARLPYVAIITPPETWSEVVNLPVIEPLLARPAEALLPGAEPLLL